MQGHGRCLKLFLAFALLLLQCVRGEVGRNHRDANVTGRCIEKERQALLAFKRGLVDRDNRMSSWGSEAHKQDCCRWIGVSCSNQTGHVLQLDLSYKVMGDDYSLEGSMISPKLIELQHLHHLDLRDIYLWGSPFPDFIGSLSNLRYLDMSNTVSGGKFPSQVGNLTNLVYLNLSYNFFTNAENLDWLPPLSSLRYLDLSSTNVSNVFDWLEAINKLPELTNLTLEHCELPSPILSTLSYINSSKSLASVNLRFNPLSASIFLWLSNYNTSLVHLDITHAENLDWLPLLSSLRYLHLIFGNLNNVFDWSEAINKLPELTNLTLEECNLPSPILSTLYYINSSKSLASVDLRFNQFSTASVFLWLSNYNTSLVHLDLSGNFLAGSIPDVFGNIRSLAYLDLSSNQFEGWDPHSFARLCSLKSLEELDLSWNDLTGSLPDLTNLSSLEDFDLHNNQLSGGIPESIGRMSKLKTIDFSMNSLEGVISETHFSKLSELQVLDLSSQNSSNSLVLDIHADWIPPFQLDRIILRSCKMGQKHFPKWLQTQKKFSYLDISDAGISDILPSWFWTLCRNVEFMNLTSNHIRGSFANLTLEFSYPPKLHLSSNQLEGPIPSVLSKAQYLDLSYNNLSGSISFLCSSAAIGLVFLDLSSNHLSGQVPDCLTHLQNLVILDLSNNALSGKIPTTVGSVFRIETLKLRSNRFVGQLPSSLKNCTSLVLVDVGDNKLSGPIPKWLGVSLKNLVILMLSSNHFNGSLPTQICHLTDIQILDISMNNISGSIPKCINNLTTLAQKGNSSLNIKHFYSSYTKKPHGHQEFTAAEYEDDATFMWKGRMQTYKNTLGLVKRIDLSGNRLIREIPSEITHLVGLVSLNLSGNQLTGQIALEIGNLHSLEALC